MINKSIIILALSVISVVFISGCVSQSTLELGSENGIVIKNIYTDPQQDIIEAGDTLNLYYELENIGGTTATNVMTTIYGITWITESERLDRYCEPVPRCSHGLTLYPPDPITKSPGGTESIHFPVPIPNNILPAGLKKTFPLKIRASYDYKTAATATFQAFSKRRFNRDLQLGNQLPVVSDASIPVQTTISGTPILVSIIGPDKIIVNDIGSDSSSRATRITYRIVFANIGQGYPIPLENNQGIFSSEDINLDGIIVSNVKIEGPGVVFRDCLDQNTAGDTQLTTAIRLRGGSVTKTCTLEIINNEGNDESWNSREFSPINIFFDLSYRYFVEKDISITVTAPIDYDAQ